MGRKFRDYDAAVAERDNTPIPFGIVYGEKVTLPPRLPGLVATEVTRMEGKHAADEPVPFDRIIALAGHLFNVDRVDGWLQAGMDVEWLSEMIGDAMTAYRGDTDDDADDEGDDGPPDPAPQTSSNAGASSNPTSSVSTTTT